MPRSSAQSRAEERLDATSARPRPAGAVPVPAVAVPPTAHDRLTPGTLLHLQRTLGNRAVSRMIAARAGACRTLQRAVGFEFEDPSWTVLQLQSGRKFRDPRGWFAGSGHVAPTEPEEGKGRGDGYTGENVFARKGGNHINEVVGEFNLQTAPKKGTLHQGEGYEIEPDGPYNDAGVTNRMDLEFVTHPFPESETGFKQLSNALADMQRVYSRISARAVGEWKGDEMSYEAFVTPAVHKFSDGSIYLYGGEPGGDFKPQVTTGFDLADVPQVMESLGAPQPAEERLPQEEREGRDQMRELMYGAGIKQRTEAKLLASAPALAETVLRRLVADEILQRDFEGVDALKGFLSMAFLYIVGLSYPSPEGIKVQVPLLSRYSFATLFKQVPGGAASRVNTREGRASLIAGMSAALRGEPNMKSRSKDMSGPMINVGTIYRAGTDQRVTELMNALGSFSREQWILNVLDGRDLLTPADLLAHLRRAEATEEEQEAAAKYDKSIAVYLRGHGATKSVRDVPGEERGGLALVENRAIAPKVTGSALGTRERISLPEAHAMALQYFMWAWQIKERRDAVKQRQQAWEDRLREDAHKARFLNMWG